MSIRDPLHACIYIICLHFGDNSFSILSFETCYHHGRVGRRFIVFLIMKLPGCEDLWYCLNPFSMGKLETKLPPPHAWAVWTGRVKKWQLFFNMKFKTLLFLSTMSSYGFVETCFMTWFRDLEMELNHHKLQVIEICVAWNSALYSGFCERIMLLHVIGIPWSCYEYNIVIVAIKQ